MTQDKNKKTAEVNKILSEHYLLLENVLGTCPVVRKTYKTSNVSLIYGGVTGKVGDHTHPHTHTHTHEEVCVRALSYLRWSHTFKNAIFKSEHIQKSLDGSCFPFSYR